MDVTAHYDVDLSAGAPLDWVYWGLPSSRRAGWDPQIALTRLAEEPLGSATNDFSFSWSGGTPVATATAQHDAITASEAGGLRVTVPAQNSPRRLYLWASVVGRGRLTATLDDKDVVNEEVECPGCAQGALYTIDFEAGRKGQTLVVELIPQAQAAGAGSQVSLFAGRLETLGPAQRRRHPSEPLDAGDADAGAEGRSDAASPPSAGPPKPHLDAAADLRPDADVDGPSKVAPDASRDVQGDRAVASDMGRPVICPLEFEDVWKAPLGADESRWQSLFGDPSTEEGQLRLSFDDIVARRAPFPGGYVLSFSIRFASDLSFHPQFTDGPYAPYPALVFKGGKIGLAGLYYGAPALATFGNFGGQTFAADRADVQLFVRPAKQEIAMRVSVAGTVVDSGFVARGGSNIGTLNLIGANSNGAFLGTAFLGPLRGCAGLDDAQVTAFHARPGLQAF